VKTYFSILRGINVGGRKKIKMTDLKDLYESLSLENIETYIQSGNIVFQHKTTSTSALEDNIEKKIKEVFNFDVAVFIRTKDEFQKIIENNPFKNLDINKLYVTFLTETPSKNIVKEIEKAKDESEQFSLSAKEIYLFIPNGYGRTKLSNDFFEKKLNVSATTRNWKTLNKLFDITKHQNLS
jgi:uncharacterized protein (DUF1697 family)